MSNTSGRKKIRLTVDHVVAQLKPEKSTDQYLALGSDLTPQTIRSHLCVVLKAEEFMGYENYYVKPGPLSPSETDMLEYIISNQLSRLPGDIDWESLFLELIITGITSNGVDGFTCNDTGDLLNGLSKKYKETAAAKRATRPVPWSKQEFIQLCLRIALESKSGMWFHTHHFQVANHYSMKQGGLFICME